MKSISIGDDTVGHFKPINSPRYLNHTRESIFHFTKSGRVPVQRLAVGVPFADKSNIARRGHAQDIVAAAELGRSASGIELDPAYAATAWRRLEPSETVLV